jgi:hypothetical protein
MASSHNYTVNGYEFTAIFGGGSFWPDGIVITQEMDLSDIGLISALQTLKNCLPHLEAQQFLGEYQSQFGNHSEYHKKMALLALNSPDEIPPLSDYMRQVATHIVNNTWFPKPANEKKAAHTPKPGFVYLLKSSEGYYKIGKTKDPKNRMKTFGLKLPMHVEYICLIESDDMGELETMLHIDYQSKRINGEWFDLTPEDVEYIKGLAL